MRPARRGLRLSWIPFVSAALILGGLFIGFSSCSTEKSEPREIRGHTQSFAGVAHAVPAAKGARYCSSCHGEALMGGPHLEPSCYTCHGKNWLDDNTPANVNESAAPLDHTIAQTFSEAAGIKATRPYRHHPELLQPEGTCTACHGAALEGDIELGRPSCLLCHEKKWE